MKIIALGSGTSQGIPIIGCTCEVCTSDDPRDQRLRSSVFIEYNGVNILIDIGPDFRMQFLQNNLVSIDLVLITHEHNDHIIGLDDIRAINYTQKKSIPVYAEERVINELKKRFSYAFSENPYPGVPRISPVTITTEPFTVKNVDIIPIRIQHGKLPVLGYRIEDFAYITDASFIEVNEIEKLQNLDTLIINALRKEPHYSHFTLEECIQCIKRINPKQAYITHISHNMGLYTEWIKDLPPNIRPLEDKMRIML